MSDSTPTETPSAAPATATRQPNRPTPKRNRKTRATVEAATVRLVLAAHDRIGRADPAVRDAAARLLKVAGDGPRMTEAVLGGDDTVTKALGDLLSISRDGFEAAVVDLAAMESPERVRGVWRALAAVRGADPGKLPSDSLRAALTVARGVAASGDVPRERAQQVLDLLAG